MTVETYDLAHLDRLGDNSPEAVDRLEALEGFIQTTVCSLQLELLLRVNESFGLVVAGPAYAGRYGEVWDNPQQLFTGGIILGWGPEWKRYVANAARKCRAAARENRDTQYIATNNPALFRDVVPSEADGLFPWGDFPHGGAVRVGSGQQQKLVGVSGLEADEDDLIALLAAEYLEMLENRAARS